MPARALNGTCLVAGRNQVARSGRVAARALEPGAYTALFTAKAETGRATERRTFDFRIVQP
jgi:hypothetical protein